MSAISIARIDEAQTLLIVSEGSWIRQAGADGRLARGRLPSTPCSTWPMIAYSTSPSSTPERSTAARIAIAELGRLLSGQGRRACRRACGQPRRSLSETSEKP